MIPRTKIPAVTKQDLKFDKLETIEDLDKWIAIYREQKTSRRTAYYWHEVLKMAIYEWLTPDDLVREYGISKSTQSKYRMSTHKAKIPFSKIGRFIRYRRDRIDQWLNDNQVQ